jgi:hypothetical protein
MKVAGNSITRSADCRLRTKKRFALSEPAMQNNPIEGFNGIRAKSTSTMIVIEIPNVMQLISVILENDEERRYGFTRPQGKGLKQMMVPVGGRNVTGAKIQIALERASVELIDVNGAAPAVVFRKPVNGKSGK